MKTVFLKDSVLSELEADYMVSLLSNIIPAAMNIWYQHSKTESPMESCKQKSIAETEKGYSKAGWRKIASQG